MSVISQPVSSTFCFYFFSLLKLGDLQRKYFLAFEIHHKIFGV